MFPYTAKLWRIPVHKFLLWFPLCIVCVFDEAKRGISFRVLRFCGSSIFSTKSISTGCYSVWGRPKFTRIKNLSGSSSIRINHDNQKEQKHFVPFADLRTFGKPVLLHLWPHVSTSVSANFAGESMGVGDGAKRAQHYQKLRRGQPIHNLVNGIHWKSVAPKQATNS